MKITQEEIYSTSTFKNVEVEMEDGRIIITTHSSWDAGNMAIPEAQVEILDEGDQPKDEKEKDAIIDFIEANVK